MTTRKNAGGMCRLEWGHRGARQAADRGDVLVVVDVLSFSSAAVTASSRGVQLYPCVDEETARQIAALHNAEIAVRRDRVPSSGRFSLSPETYLSAGPADHVALPSPNGATCCHLGAGCPAIIVGCLLNSAAAARAADSLSAQYQANITILACGGRWESPSEEGQLRFALEDYLGAGSILSCLDRQLSPEAAVCVAAFRSVRESVLPLLSECASGIELRERGYYKDVSYAAQIDTVDTVPILIGDCLSPYRL